MNYQVVKLIPSDNFRMRIGKGRMDRIEGQVHADTLFSALVNVGIKLNGEEHFIPMADFLCISSVFYGLRVQEGKTNRDILFFPRPKGRFHAESGRFTITLSQPEWGEKLDITQSESPCIPEFWFQALWCPD